jgi:hypothetical protein
MQQVAPKQNKLIVACHPLKPKNVSDYSEDFPARRRLRGRLRQGGVCTGQLSAQGAVVGVSHRS